MASSYQRRASGLLNDYKNMRTLPAALSVAFIAASLYQFGGITTLTIEWLDYTLTTEHSVLISLGAYAAAFASSQTRRFESYDEIEQAAIVAGPALILGHEYTTEVTNFLTDIGDPLGLQLAFLATVVGWAVATQ